MGSRTGYGTAALYRVNSSFPFYPCQRFCFYYPLSLPWCHPERSRAAASRGTAPLLLVLDLVFPKIFFLCASVSLWQVLMLVFGSSFTNYSLLLVDAHSPFPVASNESTIHAIPNNQQPCHPRALRSFAYRIPPRRWRAHRALQLALRAQARRQTHSAHRGYGLRTLHHGDGRGHPRWPQV